MDWTSWCSRTRRTATHSNPTGKPPTRRCSPRSMAHEAGIEFLSGQAWALSILRRRGESSTRFSYVAPGEPQVAHRHGATTTAWVGHERVRLYGRAYPDRKS